MAEAVGGGGGAEANALALQWAFGFNNKLCGGVHNLSTEDRFTLFYISAHSGVIYDCAARTQKLLQGHCNPITACAVSADKKWIATADTGPDSLIVVWDSYSGTPIKTFFNPAPYGIAAMDMSPDGAFLATLSAVPPDATDDQFDQTLAIWEWTSESEREGPVHAQRLPLLDAQSCIRFNLNDPQEIVTNGAKHVFFWNWMGDSLSCYAPLISKNNFRTAVGSYSASCFLPNGQAITGTADGDLILWEKAASSTVEAGGVPGASMDGGEHASIADGSVEELAERSAVKMIHLGEGALNVVTTVDDKYVCLAGEDGAVRFYDMQFRLEAWFEDLEAGPITSVSFSAAPPNVDPSRLDFSVPDIIVGTRNGYIVGLEAVVFEEVEPEARRGTLLVQGMSDEVHGIATHPSQPYVVIASYSGALYLWDYNQKVLVMVRQFDASRLRPRCVAYEPNANYLAIGFTSGIVKVLDPATLEDVVTFKNAKDPIVDISFSPLGDMFATADADHHVAVWKLSLERIVDENANGPEADADPSAEATIKATWVYLGRHRSHWRPITALEFGLRDDGRQTLVSVGEDRCLVEYDLEKSSVGTGVLLKEEPKRIEVSAVPTAATWHPLLGTGANRDFEDRIVTANSEYKMMQWNADNKSCRRTTLGPTFGQPINKLLPLVKPTPRDPDTDAADTVPHERLGYMAYSTGEKVVGLCKLPLNGNPNKAMGLIAHPGPISCIAVCHDAQTLVTAGGSDATVNLWQINTEVLDAAEAGSYEAPTRVDEAGVAMAEEELSPKERAEITRARMAPFLALLEGGEGGEAHEELVDFFYYAQLRSQGENTTAPREVGGRVPLSEIPNLMRALGYYPSEAQVSNMVNEVKYSKFTTTGEVLDSVDLPQFIQLYVNHRPIFGVDKPQVEGAFKVLAEAGATQALQLDGEGGGGPPGSGASKSQGPTFDFAATFGDMSEVNWAELKAALTTDGEALSADDLAVCLRALTGSDELPDGPITAGTFIDQVLGFEDEEEDE